MVDLKQICSAALPPARLTGALLYAGHFWDPDPDPDPDPDQEAVAINFIRREQKATSLGRLWLRSSAMASRTSRRGWQVDDEGGHEGCDAGSHGFRPRILIDVSHIDMSSSVLGYNISMPFMIAPTASHKMAHPEGELPFARAAATAGTIMTLSSWSSYSIDKEVNSTGPGIQGQELSATGY
ncbi:unnamed protein product [Urochloa humidicola]